MESYPILDVKPINPQIDPQGRYICDVWFTPTHRIEVYISEIHHLPNGDTDISLEHPSPKQVLYVLELLNLDPSLLRPSRHSYSCREITIHYDEAGKEITI